MQPQQKVSVRVRDEAGWKTVSLDKSRYNLMAGFVRDTRTFYEGASGPAGEMSAHDATEAESFTIAQLTYLEQEAIRKWYTPLRYQEILGECIDFSAGPGAKSVDYTAVQASGVGKRISPAATDVPLVENAYEKKTIGVAPGGIGYSYTQEDLRTAAILKQALPANQQEDAVLAYRRHMNNVALTGEAVSGFSGLYNNAGVTAATRTSGAVWDSATADTIVNDIVTGYQAFVAATQDNERPTKVVFPLTSFGKLYLPRSTNSDTTILKFIEETLNVKCMSDTQLETLGGSGSKRVVFVAPRKSNMVLHIPLPVEFMAPQLSGYRIVVPAFYKYAGFEIRRVQTVRYMDGV